MYFCLCWARPTLESMVRAVQLCSFISVAAQTTKMSWHVGHHPHRVFRRLRLRNMPQFTFLTEGIDMKSPGFTRIHQARRSSQTAERESAHPTRLRQAVTNDRRLCETVVFHSLVVGPPLKQNQGKGLVSQEVPKLRLPLGDRSSAHELGVLGKTTCRNSYIDSYIYNSCG